MLLFREKGKGSITCYAVNGIQIDKRVLRTVISIILVRSTYVGGTTHVCKNEWEINSERSKFFISTNHLPRTFPISGSTSPSNQKHDVIFVLNFTQITIE